MSNINKFFNMVGNDSSLQSRVADADSPAEIADIATEVGIPLSVSEVEAAFGSVGSKLGADELASIAGGAPKKGGGGTANTYCGQGTCMTGCETSTWDSCYSC